MQEKPEQSISYNVAKIISAYRMTSLDTDCNHNDIIHLTNEF